MMEPIAFRYSKVSSTLFTLLCTGIIIASSGQLIKFLNSGNSTNAWLIIAFDAFFAMLAIYLVVKFLIPALTGKIALELNSKGIVSNTKNISVDWGDISSIELNPGKSFSYLDVQFKYPTDYGKNIRIPLGYIEGKDLAIRDTVMIYFDRYRN